MNFGACIMFPGALRNVCHKERASHKFYGTTPLTKARCMLSCHLLEHFLTIFPFLTTLTRLIEGNVTVV